MRTTCCVLGVIVSRKVDPDDANVAILSGALDHCRALLALLGPVSDFLVIPR
jgi:hypothetical protein